MIISFVWPSSHHYAGGVRVLWELASGLARRGHEVHFVHGPATPIRINHLDELPPFSWDPRVEHHIVDSLEDPALPAGDVVFHADAPARLGLPAVFIQGFRMIPSDWEREAFRARAPKVCVARWLVDVARRFGARDEQLWYVPLGLDHQLFRAHVSQAERTYDVGFLHNSHGQKGWAASLQTLRELHRRGEVTKSLVFGIYAPDDDLPPGTDLVVGLGQARLADEVLNQVKVFVQSSIHEGFGYTAVEAMACGAALVTTDNGGSRDYAVPGETALVVPPGDVDGLVESVERLVRDDAERLRLAEAGERYVRRFDWDLSAELLESHLVEYVADPDRFQLPPLEPEPSAG